MQPGPSEFYLSLLRAEEEKSKLSSKLDLCSEQRIVALQLNKTG